MGKITAKLTRKASNKKGFQLEGQEGWFNANSPVVPYLEKIEIGKIVEVEYTQKGAFKNVSKIVVVSDSPKKEEKPTGKLCPVCHKELKNDKYPTCFECKDKVKKEPAKTDTPKVNKEQKTDELYSEPKKFNSYDNPEKTEQIRRGNAINAAAAAVSGNMVGTDPTTIAEAVKSIAIELLEWLKA